MKRFALLAVAALTLSAASMLAAHEARSAPETASWNGDTVHSFVLFKIKHMNASWTWGRFNDFAVSVEADDAGADLKSVSFDVKTASVDTGSPKRDGHLKSPDFFNAKQFADITFKSTGVKSAGGDAWDVTGDLTLHGVTKSVTVKVAKVGAGKGMDGGSLLGLESTFEIKRSDYGMDKMVGPVGDEVSLTVTAEVAKK